MQTETSPDLMSLDTAATQLSLSVWTLIAHSRKGSLKTVKCGRRRMVPRGEVQRIASEGLPSLSTKK